MLMNRAVTSSLSIWIITGVFVVLGICASLKTPLFQGYDEGYHYAYVEHYALGRPLVNLNKPFLSGDPAAPYWQTHEASQPFLYYWLMGQMTGIIPRGDLMQEELLEAGAPNGMFGNFLPADNGSLGSGHALAGHMVRFATVIMGAVLVVAGYHIARLLTGNYAMAYLTAAILAFNPRDILLSAQISNDMAVAAMAALTLLLSTWMLTRPGHVHLWHSLLLGGCAGATLLTKYSGGAVVVAAAVTIFCLTLLGRHKFRWLIKHMAMLTAGFFVITGWYFL